MYASIDISYHDCLAKERFGKGTYDVSHTTSGVSSLGRPSILFKAACAAACLAFFLLDPLK
jgi:hypothetical protein